MILHTCIILLHELIQLPSQAKFVGKRLRSIYLLKLLQQHTGVDLIQVVILNLGCNGKPNSVHRLLFHGHPLPFIHCCGLTLLKSLINPLLHQQVLYGAPPH
ncbi:unnamed protein product [Amaranthus hypochondriacus]